MMSADKTNLSPYIKSTRCLIDFDGTIAASLEQCNMIIDEMFLGKIADKPYTEYYPEFGDAFEIIPGCPWKKILIYLCRYWAKEQLVSPDIPDAINNGIISKRQSYDIGALSAILLMSYDAAFDSFDPQNVIAYYRLPNGSLIGALLEEPSSPFGLAAAIDEIRERQDSENMDGECALLIPSMDGATGDDVLAGNGASKRETPYRGAREPRRTSSSIGDRIHVITLGDAENALYSMFEERVIEKVSRISYDELAIDPVIDFCRRYSESGGSLVIQSGSNPAIISSMLDKLGIAGLFDAMFCAPEVIDEGAVESPWSYKTQVITAAESAFDDGRACFVIGDSKGDAFGAYECGLPFYLCWRGYPSDPSRIASEDGTINISDDWSDCSQSRIESLRGTGDLDEEVDKMMSFAESVGKGEAAPPVLDVRE